MRVGSLFSGAGGLDMAVQAVFGGEVVWHSEIDKAASKVLAYRWPNMPNLGSITDISWANWRPVFDVDIICGGYPCQPFSMAGQREGTNDERHLWPYFAEAIRRIRPRYAVLENVAGHRSMGFDSVLADLAAMRYDAQWCSLRASDVGAPHHRERLFVLASDTDNARRPGEADNTRGGKSDAAGCVVRGESCGCSTPRTVKVLPTPKANDGTGGCHNSPGHQDTLPGTVRLLPTPRSSDCFGAGQHGDGGMDLRTTVSLLCTPSASDGAGGKTSRSGGRIDEPLLGGQAREMATAWGKYEPAIRRWEHLTRPAPAPTEPNKNGNPRLSAAFSEWLMGWPAGWVTDPAIGISRNDQLRIVGNGVCPQQAAAALRWLLQIAQVAA